MTPLLKILPNFGAESPVIGLFTMLIKDVHVQRLKLSTTPGMEPPCQWLSPPNPPDLNKY